VSLSDLIALPGEWQADMERKDGTKRFSMKVFLAGKFSGHLRFTSETTPEWVNVEDVGNYDLLPNVKDIVVKGIKFATRCN